MNTRNRSGFTLVELLIVVIILSILAAVVIPQFGTSSTEAKEAALMTNLAAVRNAIAIYKVQHDDSFPGSGVDWSEFERHLTTATQKDGSAGGNLGPYLRTGIPRNPFNNLNDGTSSAPPWTADDATGWFYNPATGELRANTTGTGPSGIDYLDM